MKHQSPFLINRLVPAGDFRCRQRSGAGCDRRLCGVGTRRDVRRAFRRRPPEAAAAARRAPGGRVPRCGGRPRVPGRSVVQPEPAHPGAGFRQRGRRRRDRRRCAVGFLRSARGRKFIYWVVHDSLKRTHRFFAAGRFVDAACQLSERNPQKQSSGSWEIISSSVQV